MVDIPEPTKKTFDRWWARTTVDEEDHRLVPENHGNGYVVTTTANYSEYLHRWSYRYHKGPIPGSLEVLHTCDVPNCWNPAHLYAGTQVQNMRDVITRDRQTQNWNPENARQGKLNWTKVRELRRRYDPYLRNGMVLCAEFGISRTTLNDITSYHTWVE